MLAFLLCRMRWKSRSVWDTFPSSLCVFILLKTHTCARNENIFKGNVSRTPKNRTCCQIYVSPACKWPKGAQWKACGIQILSEKHGLGGLTSRPETLQTSGFHFNCILSPQTCSLHILHLSLNQNWGKKLLRIISFSKWENTIFLHQSVT